MQQVADWLEKLGLGQYAQRFAENDISFIILTDLTDQDLEKIGVASLGHRRLLLRAIAELKLVDKTTLAPDAAASAPPAAAKMDTAERRQVTVMFSDLVGSTALSARMDPKTSAKSFRPIRSASQRPWVASAASWRNIWVMASSSTSAIRRLTRTTQSGLCAQGWSSSPQSRRSKDAHSPSDPCRHCDRAGSCRRPDRFRCFSGASHRRRDAEPCGSLAGHCRAKQRGHCGEHTQAPGQPVRA